MIMNKALKIFLIALGSTATAAYADQHNDKTTLALKTQVAGLERPVAGIRGRMLQGGDDEDDEEMEIPEPEVETEEEEEVADVEEPEEADAEEEMDMASTDEDVSSSGDASGDRSTRSGVLAPTMRMCTTDETKDEVDFECRASSEDTSSTIKDKLSYRVGAKSGDFLKIGIDYKSKIETTATDMETKNTTKVEYTLVYDRIIEYRKIGTAADNHYEWGVDEVVNTWPLEAWQDMTPVEPIGDLLKFSVSDGIASFNFTIAQAESVDLTANHMKIDFLLENYPWDASGDTWLALVSHLETERTIKTKTDGSDVVEDVVIDFEPATAENAIEYIPLGEYFWAKTAEVSGPATADEMDVLLERSADNMTEPALSSSGTVTIQVVASTSPEIEVDEGKTYSEIAFSFVGEGAQGADWIYWDPEVGVGYQASSAMAGGARLVFGSLMASMAATVAAMIVCY